MNFWVVNLLVLFLSTGWIMGIFASEDKPLRIVSINVGLTEIVYELGAQGALVGTTSLYPAAATKLPQVGYQRNLSIEGILSLKPTHILVSAEAGPPIVLQQLKNSGIEIIQFAQQYSMDAVLDRIRVIAQLTDKKTEGDILINEIRQQFDDARQLMEQLHKNKWQAVMSGKPEAVLTSGNIYQALGIPVKVITHPVHEGCPLVVSPA